MKNTYTRPPAATRDAVLQLLNLAGWTRKDLAQATHVAESTVDQWVAAPTAKRASAMPAGLYELALGKYALEKSNACGSP